MTRPVALIDPDQPYGLTLIVTLIRARAQTFDYKHTYNCDRNLNSAVPQARAPWQ